MSNGRMLCIILLTNLLSLSKVASLHTEVDNYPMIVLP